MRSREIIVTVEWKASRTFHMTVPMILSVSAKIQIDLLCQSLFRTPVLFWLIICVHEFHHEARGRIVKSGAWRVRMLPPRNLSTTESVLSDGGLLHNLKRSTYSHLRKQLQWSRGCILS